MRDGKRSEPTAFTKAVVSVLHEKLEASDVPSTHALAKRLDGQISRSQLYALFSGAGVMDVAELAAICEVLGTTPVAVVREAELRTHGPSARRQQMMLIQDEAARDED